MLARKNRFRENGDCRSRAKTVGKSGLPLVACATQLNHLIVQRTQVGVNVTRGFTALMLVL
jgi:hypothetical protein